MANEGPFAREPLQKEANKAKHRPPTLNADNWSSSARADFKSGQLTPATRIYKRVEQLTQAILRLGGKSLADGDAQGASDDDEWNSEELASENGWMEVKEQSCLIDSIHEDRPPGFVIQTWLIEPSLDGPPSAQWCDHDGTRTGRSPTLRQLVVNIDGLFQAENAPTAENQKKILERTPNTLLHILNATKL